MGLVARGPVFVCDVCGFATEDLENTYRAVTLPDGSTNLLCVQNDCAGVVCQGVTDKVAELSVERRSAVAGGQLSAGSLSLPADITQTRAG